MTPSPPAITDVDLRRLAADPFYALPAPKSTGKEHSADLRARPSPYHDISPIDLLPH
jgi:hypothetical protein